MVYLCACECVCMYVLYMCVCVSSCICMCVYVSLCICVGVHVYTSSWWKMNASRSLNSPSHVHVLGCAHAEAQEKLQHAKAGPNPGWFQTKCVGQRQCATRCMQNSRRANPVSSTLELTSYRPVWKSFTTALALSNTIQGMLARSSSISTLDVSNIFL